MRIKITKSPAQNGLNVEGGKYKTLSSDGINLLGKSHEKGGTIVSSNGEVIEAEANEPIYTGSDGSNYVFGNVKNPESGKLFKNESRDILKKKGLEEKKAEKANTLMSESDPEARFESLKFNAGQVKLDAANINTENYKAELDTLAQGQESLLNYAEATNQDPKKVGKQMMRNGGKIKIKIKGLPQAQDGKKMESPFLQRLIGEAPQLPEYLTPQQKAQQQSPVQPVQPLKLSNKPDMAELGNLVRNTAAKYGINPELYEKQIYQESGYNPSAVSVVGARGLPQLMKGTAKELGLTDKEWRSTKPEDIVKQVDAGARYMAQLKERYNGDEKLAIAAYNGGMGNIDKNLERLAKSKGVPKGQLTGEDWYQFMSTRPDLPKGQRQTVDYYRNLIKLDTKDFYDEKGAGKQVTQLRRDYYEAQPTPIEEISRPTFGAPPLNTANDFNYNYQAPQPTLPGYETTNNEQAQQLQQQIANRPNSVQPLGTTQNQASEFRRNRLNPLDFLGEMAAILDQPDYVQGQQYQPVLQTPYRISFQDVRNQNTNTFNALTRNMSTNPEAAATLAGQRYQQDMQSYGQEFRANQEIQDRVLNANNQILNQAELTNLQLRDQQYQRQAAAEANTDMNRMNALTSLSNKVGQNRLYNNMGERYNASENRTAGLMRNLYSNYSFDELGNANFTGANPYQINYGGLGETRADIVRDYARIQAEDAKIKAEEKKRLAGKSSQAAFGYKFKKK